MKETAENRTIEYFNVRILKTNINSIKMFESIGAVKDGNFKSRMLKNVEELSKENPDLIGLAESLEELNEHI